MTRTLPALLCILGACALSACLPQRNRSADACPPAPPSLSPGAGGHALKTVFLVVLENQAWAAFEGNPAAPYVNGTLLERFAHATDYRNGGLHPSLPNYIALEAGDPLGIDHDFSPAEVPLSVTCHLATWLEASGVSWRAYEEGIDGTTCPVDDDDGYAVRHDPFVYFEDVSGEPPGIASARCISHVRPHSELARDLQAGTVARYNFIGPNLCHSGHDRCAPFFDPVRQVDDWLAGELPVILASRAWRDGGVVLITWDEAGTGDPPIGLIAVSPLAKPGYAGALPYSHASTLRTVEEILGVRPLLRRADTARGLSDLFTTYP